MQVANSRIRRLEQRLPVKLPLAIDGASIWLLGARKSTTVTFARQRGHNELLYLGRGCCAVVHACITGLQNLKTD